MVRALAVMDREATNAGHQPLSPDAWETPLADGSVLAIVRTTPEAHAVAAIGSGRAMAVYSLAEIARIIDQYHTVNAIKREFPGARVVSPMRMSEGQVADVVTADPMTELLHTEVAA
jgi:hypothetical protein